MTGRCYKEKRVLKEEGGKGGKRKRGKHDRKREERKRGRRKREMTEGSKRRMK